MEKKVTQMNKWNLLACSGCRGGLALETYELDDQDTCREGLLTCNACPQWYPITNGIPRLFIRGPLRPDDGPFLSQWKKRLPGSVLTATNGKLPAATGQAQVQSTFGHKWTRQAWWGMEGESAKVMEEWLLPRYGWPDRKAYTDFMKTKHIMLDAGCGLGREALRMAQTNPQSQVIALELSECVNEAARHAREQGVANVLYIQADLTAPPLKYSSFDFIISEGVLHHTPDTKQAFKALAPLLAPGGEIGFYVYRKKAPLREYADDYIRHLIQDLPPDKAWEMMEPLTKLGKALSDLKTEIEVPEDVPVLGIKSGRYDLQRLIYYTMFKCYWNDRLSFDENVHINFDWYHPRYAWRHTEAEVRQWISNAGLRLVHENIEESGITVRAKR
ncbi:MAG: methyltransferase domain-containing protein [bacterium]|nr:methyltransferase domain-containing protein [bacterium]